MLCLVARFEGREFKFPIPRERAQLGASSSADLPLPVPGVSRAHAWVEPAEGGIRLEDAGSRNRLIVNGRRLDEVTMHPGDAVQVGRAVLSLEEVPTGEFDLALRASCEPRRRPGDATAESDGLGVTGRGSPTEILRLLRSIESTGSPSESLAGTSKLLGAQSIALFSVSEEGEVAIDALAGDVTDGLMLASLEHRCAMKEVVPTTTRVGEANSLLCVLFGIRGSRGVAALVRRPTVEHWEEELLQFLVTKLPGGAARPPEPKPQKARERRALLIPQGMVVGESTAFRDLMSRIEGAVASKMDVLLLGETGTGKEFFARMIHSSGATASGPFVAINCAAIPTDLLEAELFGVEARYATGVDARTGRFVRADGGSIFLDEIGELAEPLQAKMLRVLQEREVLPLGASEPRHIDLRVIAASNRDLLSLVDQGRFRRDLYYRLAGLEFRIPPLRERPDDIPALALAFLERFAHEQEKTIRGISRRALELLLAHDWPGNVRELQNEIARAVLHCHEAGILRTEHFPSVLRALQAGHSRSGEVAAVEATIGKAASLAPAVPPRASITEPIPPEVLPRPHVALQERLDAVEREEIRRALESTSGNKTAAARLLGITRNGLALKMKRLGFEDPPDA
ncbi:MAG: sigma 54-interacting transcriptional regulator [Acidobacteria bacterium]|nr:sigma 54-interacting transcriptional regulator [Acidobacteriota bacterium]